LLGRDEHCDSFDNLSGDDGVLVFGNFSADDGVLVGVDLLTAWGGKEKRERKRRRENSALTARLSTLLLSFSGEQCHYHRLRLRGGSFPKEVSGRPTVPVARVRFTTAFTI
jgi:hypothetical protein